MLRGIVSLVVLGLVSLSVPARAALTPGIDCGCTKTGDYVLPKSPKDIEPADGITTLSPDGTYSVSASGSPGNYSVTVTRVSDSTDLLLGVPATYFGFSPDEDRFVIYRLVAGVPQATVYNLAGTPPLQPILQTDLGASGRVSFSPNGHYMLVMTLSAAGPGIFALRVHDAVTGTERHYDEFAFASSPGLPPGQTKLGAVRVGFGPDQDDRSLVYAWIAGNGLLQKNLMFLNLGASPPRKWFTPSNYAFDWWFSPCGDVFANVSQRTDIQKKTPRLHATLDMAEVGYDEFPIANTYWLEVSTVHQLTQGTGVVLTLGTHEADDACSVTPPVSPVAAFSIGNPRLHATPIPFTDQSSTSQGTLTRYDWSFGDGGRSTTASPSYAYAAPGSYMVRLTVTNSFGRADSVEHGLTVGQNLPPVPSFTYAPNNPNSRDIVTFTDTSTSDDGFLDFYWTINGQSYMGSVVNAKVCAPTTDVSLTVRDNAGQEGRLDTTITVGGSNRLTVAPGGDIAAAAAGACPGDTVVLQAGTYPGGVTVTDVNLEGAGPGVSVIDGADPEGWALKLAWTPYLWDMTPISVSSLTVTGGQTVTGTFGGVTGGGLQILENQGDVVIDDVEFSHNDGIAGLYRYNSSYNVVVQGSSAHHNGGIGLNFNVAQGTVVDSELSFNGIGAWFDEGGGSLERVDVHDNVGEGAVFRDADGYVWTSRFYGNGAGRYALSSSDSFMEVAGCLVAENHGGGLQIDDQTVVTHTTIANNCETGLDATQGGSLYNSIVAGNAADLVGTLGDEQASSVSVDPLFAGSGDFHLSSLSPGLDQADPAHTPGMLTVDADGDARSLAASGGPALPDLGWDEWRAGQPADVLPVLSCAGGTGGTGGGGGTGGTGGTVAGGGPGAAGDGGDAGDDAVGGRGGTMARGGTGGVSASGGSTMGESGSGGSPGGEGGEAGASTGGTSGRGGAGRAGSSGAGAGAGRGGAAPPTNGGGCGCRVAGERRSSSSALAVLAMALAAFARRRRR
jgi:MYXO-CTERM domain-containing protein